MTIRNAIFRTTDKTEIEAQIRAGIQALSRMGESKLAIEICEQEAGDLRLQGMSEAELDAELADRSFDYAHSLPEGSNVVRLDSLSRARGI